MWSANLEGMEEVKKLLDSKRLADRMALRMGQSLVELHDLLNQRILAKYNFPYWLDSCLVTPIGSYSVEVSQNTIKTGIVYQKEATPLFQFPHFISSVPVPPETQFKAPNIYTPTLKGRIKRKKPLEQVTVSVTRGKLSVIEGAFTGTVGGQKHILLRKTDKTWIQEPTEDDLVGERAPYKRLYGPNILSIAQKLWEEDNKIIEFRLNLIDLVAEAILQ